MSRRWSVRLGLLLILLLAAYVRLYRLWPVATGLLALQDYDEGVWNTTAQLWIQGFMPYRDFFATLPPLGIYLLAAVLRLVYVPWGSGMGLMWTRYASAAYGVLTVAVLYLIGKKLCSRSTGLLAALLLAVDGMVISIDRLAMLEPSLNLFSCLAMLAYLGVRQRADDNRTRRWSLVVCGALAGLAALAKTPGMVVILALGTVSVLEGKWYDLAWLCIGFLVTWFVLSAPFLWCCADDFVKQVYFFQLLRPADGLTNRLARILSIWGDARSWSTVRLGGLGLIGVVLGVGAKRLRQDWLLILAWVGWIMFLVMVNSSYYPQYFVQAVPPLCLLGAALLVDLAKWVQQRELPGLNSRTLILLGLVLLVLLCGSLQRQYLAISTQINAVDATYSRVADYLREHALPDDQVLAFEPNYTFLGSRQPASTEAGQYLVDSYGGMLYAGMGISDSALAELLIRLLRGKSSAEAQTVFWRQPAQEQIVQASAGCSFLVVDGRARYQVRPQVLTELQEQSQEVFTFGVAAVRAMLKRPH